MLAGSTWLYVTSRRQPGVLNEIELDLETLTAEQHHDGALTPAGPVDELEPHEPVTVAAMVPEEASVMAQ
jgi:hypothetical protein